VDHIPGVDCIPALGCVADLDAIANGADAGCNHSSHERAVHTYDGAADTHSHGDEDRVGVAGDAQEVAFPGIGAFRVQGACGHKGPPFAVGEPFRLHLLRPLPFPQDSCRCVYRLLVHSTVSLPQKVAN
jgi:hypothetical protein